MGTPVKVSDELFSAARREAGATERSITAQVEHWANIGRSVETALSHTELLNLKAIGEIFAPVTPSPVRRKRIQAILEHVVEGTDRRKVTAAIRRAGQPVYSADPDHPGRLIRTEPGGRRQSGRLVGRRFVPDGRSPAE